MKLRLKTLEEGLKHVSSFSTSPTAFCASPKTEKSTNILGFLTANNGLRKRSTSQPRASINRSSLLQQPNVENGMVNAIAGLKPADIFRKKYVSGENVLRKSLWPSKNKVADSNEKENAEVKENKDTNVNKFKDDDTTVSLDVKSKVCRNEDSQNKGNANPDSEDLVSGFLYDRLQKEVIHLRKFCGAKDTSLNAKDEEIKVNASLFFSLFFSQAN